MTVIIDPDQAEKEALPRWKEWICDRLDTIYERSDKGEWLAQSVKYGVLMPVLLPVMLYWMIYNDWRDKRQWPKTVDEAVDRLLDEMSEESRRWYATDDSPTWTWKWRTLNSDIKWMFGLGSRRRNRRLIASCGCENEDNPGSAASGVIMNHLMSRLLQESVDSQTKRAT